MAMNKKEQEQVRELKRKLSTLAALRWTDEVEPDLPYPIGGGDKVTKGWESCYNRVEQSMSTCIYHHTGSWDEKTNSWSQRPIQLYSSKLLALKALRHEMELRFAEELARVDIQIAEEKGLSE